MTDHVCELGNAPSDCHELQDFLSDLVDSMVLLDNLRTGIGDDSYITGNMEDMWLQCAAPTGAVGYWYYIDTFSWDNQNMIRSRRSDGTWLGIRSLVPVISPYYTSFEGEYGPLKEGWEGNWFIDGNGSTRPDLIFDTFNNYLTNGDFEEWTGAIPDNWTVVTGTTAQENVIVYEGQSSVDVISAVATGRIAQTAITVPAFGWYQFSSKWYYPLVGGAGVILGTTAGPILTGFLGNSREVLLQQQDQDSWISVSCTDYATTLSTEVYIDGTTTIPASNTGYADAATLYQITDGWKTLKEFYSAYGTFTLDFTIEEGDYAGILLNYVPISSLYTDDAAFYMVVANRDKIFLIQQIDVNTVNYINWWAYTYVPGATLEVISGSGGIGTISLNYNGVPVFVGTYPSTIDPLGTRHGMISTTEYSPIQAFTYEPV